MSKSSFSIRNSHPRELEFLDEYNMRKINLTPPSSGYSQSASLLAHNRMLLRSLSGVACTTPDTSKSQPTAYCFAQLKQGTCLIRLNTHDIIAFSHLQCNTIFAEIQKGFETFFSKAFKNHKISTALYPSHTYRSEENLMHRSPPHSKQIHREAFH